MTYFLMILFFLIDGNDTTVLKLQSKFESIKFLQADFNQINSTGSSLTGRFYFKKENNYRIELASNIIISDGSSIWNEDTKRRKVVISNIDEDPLAFSLYDYIYNYPSKCEISEETSDDGFVIILDGKNTDLNFKTAKLWINDRYLINKIVVTDFGGNSFTLSFTNIIIDKSIDGSYFQFEHDGDKKLIDLR